jgi:thiol-disulfide isomerase/thioredoxin
MRFCATLSFITLGLSALMQPVAAGWELPPAGYSFTATPGCDGPRPTSTIYDACVDQMALFTRARTEAYGAGKQLLIVFGATWCPSCKSLKAALPSSDVLGRSIDGKALSDRVQLVEIAVSTLALGRVTSVPSGQAVLEGIMAAPAKVKLRAVPFLVVLDPVSGRTSARNLDDLEANGGGWNRAGLAVVIAAADVETRGGAAANPEPGWLQRKWLRWFGAS